MKAIVLTEPGGTENLVLKEIEKPSPAEGEVLVQVKAFSINPIDIKTRKGKGFYELVKTQSPLILGWDISGVVVESASPEFAVGDEVFGMINVPGLGKAYAEYVVAPAGHLALKPSDISHEEAAATPLAALTALQAFEAFTPLKKGDKVLVHAAAGGVGHFAVQLAKIFGAVVTGTSSAANKDFVLGLGADHHIDYRSYNWEASNEQFDFILDTIGADNIDNSLFVAKPGSTIVSLPSGLNQEVGPKAKARNVNGHTFRTWSSADDMLRLAKYLSEKKLRPHLSRVYSIEQIAAAHHQIETGRTVGKLIVKI